MAVLSLFGLISLTNLAADASTGYAIRNSGSSTAGDGTSLNTAYRFEVDVTCTATPAASSFVALNAAPGTVGTWYQVVVHAVGTGCSTAADLGVLSSAAQLSARLSYNPSIPAMAAGTSRDVKFQLDPDTAQVSPGTPFAAGIEVTFGGRTLNFGVEAVAGSGGGSSSSPAPDPTAGAVSLASEQAAAAGVAGSSGAVRVRGGEVVPVTSRISGAVGPRGGVVLSSEDLEVRVAAPGGARADTGVVVPPSGFVETSVTGALVPGSVIEVWVRSDPRLVAAAAVPDDHEDGDAVTFVVPTGTPLDGGDPIEDGEHTLELRMYTADGFEVIATGMTVGGVVPTGVPAGEGPAPLGGALALLLGAVALGLVVVRRRAVRDAGAAGVAGMAG